MSATPLLHSPSSLVTLNSGLALVDSRAECNFMDSSLATLWGIPALPLSNPIPARSLNGTLITTVSHRTPQLHLSR